MSELLPCPFCGGEAHTMATSGIRAPWGEVVLDGMGCTVVCEDCGATIPSWTSEAHAIEAWNARADTEYGAVPATEENMAKHGWVRERTCHMERSFTEPRAIDHMQEYMCSECGEYAYDQTRSDDVLPNYCPNCGAKVVGR